MSELMFVEAIRRYIETIGPDRLEDFTLHYAPAGAVLQFTGDKRRPDGRGGPILIVADPMVPKQAQLGSPLAPLPGARDEALAIARQVPAGRRTTLIGPDATEVRVGAAIERNAIVHFATHAVARDDAPFESFLALGADAAGDGLMTAAGSVVVPEHPIFWAGLALIGEPE